MTLRLCSLSLFVGAALLLAGTAHAQSTTATTPVLYGPSTQEEIVLDSSSKRARIEVWFSGSQTERFVFEEGTPSIVQENGVALRQVGSGGIEMGARKLNVHVLREDQKPDVFHAHFATTSGGRLDAQVALKVGDEKTLDIQGGKPTKVSVKRLR